MRRASTYCNIRRPDWFFFATEMRTTTLVHRLLINLSIYTLIAPLLDTLLPQHLTSPSTTLSETAFFGPRIKRQWIKLGCWQCRARSSKLYSLDLSLISGTWWKPQIRCHYQRLPRQEKLFVCNFKIPRTSDFARPYFLLKLLFVRVVGMNALLT